MLLPKGKCEDPLVDLVVHQSERLGSKNSSNILQKTTTELAVIRTYLACERTYMASIRTNAIFAGLSLLLITHHDRQVSAMIILAMCVLINVFTTWNFYRSSLGANSHHFDSMTERVAQVLSPMLYSLLLNVVLVIIFCFAVYKMQQS